MSLGSANIYYNLPGGSRAILSLIAVLEPVKVGVEVLEIMNGELEVVCLRGDWDKR